MAVEIYNKVQSTVEVFKVGMLDSKVADEIRSWCRSAYVNPKTGHLVIETSDGSVNVESYSWVIKDGSKFSVIHDTFGPNLYTKGESA
jgi:hypothetical protein